jgi:hypothetical protein
VRVHTEQLKELRKVASHKFLSVSEVYEDRPNQLLEIIADQGNVPYKTLKEKLLHVAGQMAEKDPSRYDEIMAQYVQPSDAFFSACAAILNKSIVIITQKGEEQVYRCEGNEYIVLGELSGGTDASATTQLNKEWVIQDVLDDNSCLFHALGHQLRLQQHPYIQERTDSYTNNMSNFTLIYHENNENNLSARLRRKLGGMDSKFSDHVTDEHIRRFAKEFDCIVALAYEGELTKGYDYFYDAYGAIRHMSHYIGAHGLPNKPIYRIVLTGTRLNPGKHFNL